MGKNAKILIVDDDAHIRETVSDNLEIEGYKVSQAESGAAALAAVRREFFDVILMDYNLTDSTGIDVIKQIRTHNSESPILMLTAHASLDTALRAIQESVYDFLIKPVDFGYLKLAIAKALDKLRLEQENRRLIADLQKANDQLVNLNEMKSKFLSMSSHDMSNSLMTLQVSFEMLCASIAPSAEQKKHMVYISNGISQITRLIEDLVDWASIEQGKFRLEHSDVPPGPMLEEALVGPQGRAMSRGQALKAEIAPNLPPIRADRRRLLQVLNNLLENAMRHTPRGGQIMVSASARDSGVCFAVKDTGEGIAREDLDKIFRSFYQGHGQAGGGRLGLGLSIAKEIIEAHHGRIWVESPGPGLGSTFSFIIPSS
ncbi:MAG: response regulator [Elusimicrobia bacterium]|nr:response regulator [Elusimicrobiota bacterium]